MKRRLYLLPLVLVFLSWPAPAWAAPVTRYVDLTGNCAFNGDGTADQCAASAGATGAWNTKGSISCVDYDPAGGNKLQFRAGRHYVWDVMRFPQDTKCDGVAGNQNIIENVAGADATLSGSLLTDLSATPFTLKGNNEWECLGGQNQCGWSSVTGYFPMTEFYQRSDAPACGTNADCGNNDDRCTNGKCEEHLFLVQSESNKNGDTSPTYSCGTGGLLPGQMSLDQDTQKICVHLSDSSNPNNLVFFEHLTAWGGPWTFTNGSWGAKYQWLRTNPAGGKLNLHGGVRKLLTMTNLTWGITIGGPTAAYGVDIGWFHDRCVNGSSSDITKTAAADGTVIRFNTFHHCGQEGIRVTDSRSTGTLVADNEVYKVQSPEDFEKCDDVPIPGSFNCLSGFTDGGSPIRIWDCHDCTVARNEVHDTGGGKRNKATSINLEGGSTRALVEDNYIHDIFSIPNPGTNNNQDGHAIAFSGSNCTPPCSETYEGNIIRNNRIRNVGACFFYQNAADISTVGTAPNEVYNNTCTEFSAWAVHMFSGPWLSPWNYRNNIFSTDTRTPQGLWSMSSTFTGVVTPTYNDFYCPTCQTNQPLITYLGSQYDRDGICTPGTDCVQDLDPNSDYGNPNITATGQIISASGFAYNLGTNTQCAPADYLGTLRPQDGTCDIGAYEFAGVPPTTTTTTTGGPTTTTTVTTTTSTTTTLSGATNYMNDANIQGCYLFDASGDLGKDSCGGTGSGDDPFSLAGTTVPTYDSTDKQQGTGSVAMGTGGGYLNCTGSSVCPNINAKGDAALTIVAWSKLPATNSWRTIMAQGGDGNTKRSYRFRAVTGGIAPSGTIQASGVEVEEVAATSPTTVWTHLCEVYDGANVTMYVLGVQDCSTPGCDAQTGTIGAGSAGTDVKIGASISSGGVAKDFHQGSIDELAIFNRALGATECCEICRKGLAGQTSDRGTTCNSCTLPAGSTTTTTTTNTTTTTTTLAPLGDSAPSMGIRGQGFDLR